MCIMGIGKINENSFRPKIQNNTNTTLITENICDVLLPLVWKYKL